MFGSVLSKVRFLAALAIGLLLAGSVYGFAAGNTVDTNKAGDGSATISGYTISNVSYTLNSSNPAVIDAFSFAITTATGTGNAPTTVKAALSSSGTFYPCSNTTGTTWSCTTTGSPSVGSATDLRVVAAQ